MYWVWWGNVLQTECLCLCCLCGVLIFRHQVVWKVAMAMWRRTAHREEHMGVLGDGWKPKTLFPPTVAVNAFHIAGPLSVFEMGFQEWWQSIKIIINIILTLHWSLKSSSDLSLALVLFLTVTLRQFTGSSRDSKMLFFEQNSANCK